MTSSNVLVVLSRSFIDLSLKQAEAEQAAHLAADAAEGEADDDADLSFEFGMQMFATPQGAAARGSGPDSESA